MQLSNLYGSGAVFQRRTPIVIQGKTDPNTKIRCSLAGQTAYCGAGLDGRFRVRFPALEAGGPYVLRIENLKTKDSYRAEDILIGEVYLASGQSNMQFEMRQSPLQMEEFLKLGCDPETIRVVKVAPRALYSEEHDFLGEWKKASPENIPDFSAVALWFAKKLHDTLQVPVGILSSYWGGTPIEAWISRSAVMENESLTQMLTVFDQKSRTEEMWRWTSLQPGGDPTPTDIDCPAIPDEGEGLRNGWGAPEFNDSDWKDFELPGSWVARGITGNGAVWVRRTFELPEAFSGKDLILHLGGIDKNDIAYINGREAGRTGRHMELQYWDTPRSYRVPSDFFRPGKNVLSIRASSFLFDGGFNGTEQDYTLECPGEPEHIALAGHCKIAVDIPAGSVPFNPGATNPFSPTTIFNGMISPLLPYTIRGFLWYQGEANVGRAAEYEAWMKLLIQDWRRQWCQGPLPFLLVQLANYRAPHEYEDGNWPRLRESQRRAARDLPNVGMICAIDCGEEKDIHPKNKKTVGERMAAWALRHVHGITLPCEGPSPVRLLREDSALRILFENCDGGIVSSDGKPLKGFYIADERAADEFFPAEAVVEGNSVRLTSAQVDFPVRVRYAWANNPIGVNLANKAGFPAPAFEL